MDKFHKSQHLLLRFTPVPLPSGLERVVNPLDSVLISNSRTMKQRKAPKLSYLLFFMGIWFHKSKSTFLVFILKVFWCISNYFQLLQSLRNFKCFYFCKQNITEKREPDAEIPNSASAKGHDQQPVLLQVPLALVILF